MASLNTLINDPIYYLCRPKFLNARDICQLRCVSKSLEEALDPKENKVQILWLSHCRKAFGYSLPTPQLKVDWYATYQRFYQIRSCISQKQFLVQDAAQLPLEGQLKELTRYNEQSLAIRLPYDERYVCFRQHHLVLLDVHYQVVDKKDFSNEALIQGIISLMKGIFAIQMWSFLSREDEVEFWSISKGRLKKLYTYKPHCLITSLKYDPNQGTLLLTNKSKKRDQSPFKLLTPIIKKIKTALKFGRVHVL